MRQRAIFEIERGLGPDPVGTQFGGLGFKLFDRKAADQCGIVHKAFVVGIEEIARDRAAGGFISFGADKKAEIGIEGDGALGQEMPDPVRRNVRMLLELGPDC